MPAVRLLPLLGLAAMTGQRCAPLSSAYAQRPVPASMQRADRLPLARFAPSAPFTQYGGIGDSMRVVVLDSIAWNRTWSEVHRTMTPPPQLPRVDFSREMVLVVALGRRQSGGWSIVVDSARVRDGRVEAFVRRLAPGRHCGLTSATSAPVDLVRLPRRATSVRFDERLVVEDCE